MAPESGGKRVAVPGPDRARDMRAPCSGRGPESASLRQRAPGSRESVPPSSSSGLRIRPRSRSVTRV